MAKTLDDIFEDDDFGLLNPKERVSNVKSDEDRMIDAFEEINTFYAKNDREPGRQSMSEYNLSAVLKGFQADEKKKKILKPFDRFNLLGFVEMDKQTLDEIFEEDDLGLLDSNSDQSIHQFIHTPKVDKRAETDFVAQRTSITNDEFTAYEEMFARVHRELKAGARRLLPFDNMEKNLQIGNFYLLDGILLLLEDAELETKFKDVKSGGRLRIDGRTTTVFENATKSNMFFRSLGKLIQKNGKLITNTYEAVQDQLNQNAGLVEEENLKSGWIYILRSKSNKNEIASINNLFKIGFSTTKVSDRIKNASKEATYLYDEVEIVANYSCYDLNVHAFENLIHRFFASTCLNIDIYNPNGTRMVPREWFVVPLSIIDEAINLLIKGTIINYRFDLDTQTIRLR
ncbi:hypothetical protein ABIB40_003102 [Pedobacter sp. UYP30]|uniref:GIY-YIG nuclease family protein n=1 Tax=Pedobacter sp. UYP30 TaxID=1756400 RepID=UPI0033999317